MKEKIKLCDEGATMLAEAILETCREDYKYCWLIKEIYGGGKWVFASRKPKTDTPRKKYILTRNEAQITGCVDKNIKEIEEYICKHQILSEISKEIINRLRKEATQDTKMIEKVREIKCYPNME